MMPNPAGTNSNVAFDEFSQQIPYGEKRIQGALASSAPQAGEKAAAGFLGTARRAAELGRENAQQTAPQAAPSQPASRIPEEPQNVAPPNPVAELWQSIAATPGASELVKFYAQQASL